MMTRDQRKCDAHKVNSCPTCIAQRRWRRQQSIEAAGRAARDHAQKQEELRQQREEQHDRTREFFSTYGEYHAMLRFYGSHDGVSVEELFQHFKTRMEYEEQ